MESIIEVKNLHKSYGDFEAVKGLEFQVKAGELFAFLGPNGAGKSTTINILSTQLKADAGDVRIAGFDLTKQPEKVRNSIGIVFQDSVLDDLLTVRENLMTRASFYYSSSKECKKHVNEVIEITEMESFADRPYGKLSGGQRRRADIARGLLNSPQILFLDEPTTGLDPQTRTMVWEIITKLQNLNKMTIFLIFRFRGHYMQVRRGINYFLSVCTEEKTQWNYKQISTKKMEAFLTLFDNELGG